MKKENIFRTNMSFMKKIILKNKLIALAVLALVIAVPIIGFAWGQADGYRSDPGTIAVSIADGNTCRVYNWSSTSFFIPTRTMSEWNNFASRAPSIGMYTTCCGDYNCAYGEDCGSCPSDCGSCATGQCVGAYQCDGWGQAECDANGWQYSCWWQPY